MLNKHFRPGGLTAGALTLALTLSACNHDQTVTVPQANSDALKAIQQQTLTWGSCDATILPNGWRGLVDTALGKRLECADVKVPMDWNNPAHGTASVALLRVKASETGGNKRQGAIFFNPGGPGGDGLLFGALYGFLWSKADPKTPTGAALLQVSQQYDLVGFSPRGVGDSSQAGCGGNARTSPEHYQSADRSQKNIDAMLRNAQLAAKACQKNPFSPYINTDQTARDLNLARQLMGDSKLNYVGYSYGTWLGAWFAKLFPEATGHMLLDGNTAFDKNFQDSFNMQPLGFERAFREVALYFAARHNDLFELGSTKEDVYNVYDSFQPDLKLALQNYGGNSIIQSLYSDDEIVTIPVQLIAARGVSTLLRQHPDIKKASDLEKLLDDYIFAKDEDVNEAALELAYPLTETYFDIVNEAVGGINMSASNAVFTNVVCNDTPTNREPQFWIDFGNQEAKVHPLIGGGYTEQPCMYWNGPTTSKPATPATLPPILMLQNEDDPATPREGAISAWKSLPGAKMIFVDNEAQHTAFPYGTTCVDLPIANFFLSGTLPKDSFTVCGALPLPGEKQVYPVGDSYTTGVAPQSLGANPASVPGALTEQAFGDDRDSQEALKLIKDIIRRNAIQPNAQPR